MCDMCAIDMISIDIHINIYTHLTTSGVFSHGPCLKWNDLNHCSPPNVQRSHTDFIQGAVCYPAKLNAFLTRGGFETPKSHSSSGGEHPCLVSFTLAFFFELLKIRNHKLQGQFLWKKKQTRTKNTSFTGHPFPHPILLFVWSLWPSARVLFCIQVPMFLLSMTRHF